MNLSNVEIIRQGEYGYVVRRMDDELIKQRIIAKHAIPNLLDRGVCLVAVLKPGETLADLEIRMDKFKKRKENYKGLV